MSKKRSRSFNGNAELAQFLSVRQAAESKKNHDSSFSFLSIEHIEVVEGAKDEADNGSEKLRLPILDQRQESLSQRPTTPQPLHAMSPKHGEQTQPSGLGFIWTSLVSLITSEQNMKSMEELQEQYEKLETQLKHKAALYFRDSRALQNKFRSSRIKLQGKLIEWKHRLLTAQIDKSRLALKQYEEDSKQQTQIADDYFTRDKVDLRIRPFTLRPNDLLTLHEPHCPNYRANSHDDVANSSGHVEGRIEDARQGLADVLRDDMASLNDGRSSINSSRMPFPVDASDKQYVEWVNDLLAVFFDAWKNAHQFHKLVLESIQEAVNDDRPDCIDVIQCQALALEGKPPRVNWIKDMNLGSELGKTYPPCFTIEGDVEVPGKIKMMIKTAYKINWPAINWTSIDLQLCIVVSRISGRVRFQYCMDQQTKKGSYLQFLGRPCVSINIEPVAFKNSPINLKSIPMVSTVIKDVINDVIESLCYPNLIEMSVPCTSEPVEDNRT